MTIRTDTIEVGSRVSFDGPDGHREGTVESIDGAQYAVVWDERFRQPVEGGDDPVMATVTDFAAEGWFQLAQMPGSPFDGAPVIFQYLRRDALADGTLVDVSDTSEAREAGFVVPVALTRALWNVVEPNEEEEAQGQSLAGRLWDVLYLARIAIKRGGEHEQTERSFKVLFYERGRGQRAGTRTHELWIYSGPGDEGEHVLTIGYASDF